MNVEQVLAKTGTATSAAHKAVDHGPRHALLGTFALGFLFIHALSGCGGGGSDQGGMPVTYSVVPAAVPSEGGDAWQGRYVGWVTIGDVQYFGDALLTADGLIRLYVGGPGADNQFIQQTIPAGSAQGQMNQISGDSVVFGQECAASEPIRFCAEVGQASLSIALISTSPGYIQGEILVTTSAGSETWSLNLGHWTNYTPRQQRRATLRATTRRNSPNSPSTATRPSALLRTDRCPSRARVPAVRATVSRGPT